MGQVPDITRIGTRINNTTRRATALTTGVLAGVLGASTLSGIASAQEMYPGSAAAATVELSSQLSSNDVHPGSSKPEWQARVDGIVNNPLRDILAPYLP